MPVVEGKGLVAPRAEIIKIPPGYLGQIEQFARQVNEQHKYQQSNDPWKRGFVTNPIQQGKIVEFGFAMFINKHLHISIMPNMTLMKSGDGGRDFEIYGQRVEVKKGLLVRRTNGRRVLPMNADVYVFGNVAGANAELWGWLPKKKLIENMVARSPIPTAVHYNLVVDRTWLYPMKDIITHLRNVKHVD